MVAVREGRLMRFDNVSIVSVEHVDPPHVLTSEEIEERLAPALVRNGPLYGQSDVMKPVLVTLQNDTKSGAAHQVGRVEVVTPGGEQEKWVGAPRAVADNALGADWDLPCTAI